MKKRKIWLMVILSIVTFGIYTIYWLCSFQSQLKEKTGEGFGGVAHFFMLFITFGIYAIIWQYKAGKRLAMLGASDNSIIYLVLALVGLGFINPYLMQNQANKL